MSRLARMMDIRLECIGRSIEGAAVGIDRAYARLDRLIRLIGALTLGRIRAIRILVVIERRRLLIEDLCTSGDLRSETLTLLGPLTREIGINDRITDY